MGRETGQPHGLIEWLGFRRTPDWSRARPLGAIVGALSFAGISVLFVLALGAAATLLWKTVFLGADVGFGTGAVIVGLLGAPFVIWTTLIRHKTRRIEQEGHMAPCPAACASGPGPAPDRQQGTPALWPGSSCLATGV